MTEKLIPYRVNGEMFDVPESSREKFEKRYPDATIEMHVGDEIFDVPFAQESAFMNRYPDAVYGLKPSASTEEITTPISVDNESEMTRKEKRQARREARENDDRTGFFESLGKGLAAGGVGAAKDFTDLINVFNTGSGISGATLISQRKFDEALLDEDNPLYKVSGKLGDTQERLSIEADPTAGESSFWDLIKEGKLGTAMQKAVASGAESLPMMLFSRTPVGAALYGSAMAASNYIDETQENPDIPSWKRAINAAGTAALELAIERLGGPLKAKGKLTQEALTKFLDDVAKEGTETIAKRIFKGIGGVVKEGWEEGWEEVGTSFGNDVLGTALDAIDGDADYGIKAQWEQLKEENPNADAWDFAKKKGVEYMDSYIGGALSGMEISGAVKGVQKGVSIVNGESRSVMERAREIGSSMSYDDLYDTDSDVANAKTAVANSFADKDGNPTISNEFIESLSAEDAYALAGREDLSYQQRRAFGELAIAKAKSDALNGRLDTMRDERVATIRSRMEKASENGQIVTGMVDGSVVYVRGGKVNNRQVSVDKHGGHGPLLVIDSVTGEEKVVNSKDITSASVLNAEETINGMVNFILNNEASDRQTARTTMSKRAKIAAVNEFIGKRMMINSENGIIEVEVTASPQSGKVLIKGKKGDLGGQAIKPMDADVFYDSIYRNENGEPVFVEKGEKETEEVEVEVPETPAAPEAPVAAGVAEEDDFRDFTGTILVDGAPLNVSVISQDGPSDTIVYEYEDENGNTRRSSTTIGAFKAAVQQGAEYAPEAPVVPETPVAETPVAEEVPPTEETPTEEEAPVGEVELGPDDIDWDALFDSDPEAYFVELQKQFGDGAIDMLTAVVEATQEELDGLNKNKGKTQKEIFANVTKKKELQNKIDILNGMIERLTATPSPETAPEVVPDSVAEPMPEPAPETAPVVETPAPAPVEEPAPDEPVETEPVEEPAPEVVEAPAPAPETTQPTTPETPEAPQADNAPIGGALNRMFEAFKAQVDKIASKANIKDFIGKDETKPAMTGIYHAGGYDYASDSMVLAKLKSNYPSSQEGKMFSVKTGKEITAKVPAYEVPINDALKGDSLEVNIDDIIAYAQTLEEIKKGLGKSTNFYVKIGNSAFRSDIILTAAKLAKQQGLTTVLQRTEANRAMAFTGDNGVILAMPVTGWDPKNLLDITDGKIEVYYPEIKTPTTLKGIQTAKTTLEAILPNLNNAHIQELKDTEGIKFVDGKVFVFFDSKDIDKAMSKSKDAITYAALESIKTNGLEVSLSKDEIATLFPESAKTPDAEPMPETETPIDEGPDDGDGTGPIDPNAKEIVLDNGYIIKDGYVINPTPIEMPNSPKDFSRIFIAEKDGKWGYETYVKFDNMTSYGSPKGAIQVSASHQWFDTKEEAIKAALHYFDFLVRDHGSYKGKPHGNTGIDAFIQYVKDTYLKGSEPSTPEAVVPVAPNPVDDPIKEAKKREKSLVTQLKRIGIPHEQKQDMAFNAGKAVADFFATREEYEDYAENATDFGEYNADFERGVDASFANRPQNPDDSPKKTVPLENEPKTGNNGETGETPQSTEGRGDNGSGEGNDTGSAPASEGTAPAEPARGSKSKGGTKQVAEKYPARKGNATKKLLVDTFGFESVTIPNSRKETLNSIYDFLMEMAKMLGISPKSIGQGGWLGVGSLRKNANANARHNIEYDTFDGIVTSVQLQFKYDKLRAIAHEWWHSLDRALVYADTGVIAPNGRDKGTATSVKDSDFTGRKEVLDAMRNLIKAIEDSGHTKRIRKILFLSDLNYWLKPTEMAARAFDEYIRTKFIDAGIEIEGVDDFVDSSQPTAEEMRTIAPAFDKLFEILQEKEGKTPGTSILYHIGEMMDEQSDAKKLATESVLDVLKESGIDVEKVTDEQVAQMLAIRDELSSVEWMTVYHGSPQKFDEFDHTHMGEGEGAQAHGWGTYVAKSSDTAKAYAQMGRVTYTGPKQNYGSYEYEVIEDIVSIMNRGNSFEEAIRLGRRYWNNKWEPSHRPKRAFLETLTPEDFKLRNLYDVEIPEDNGENYFYEANPSKAQVQKLYDACVANGLEYAYVIEGETLLDSRPVGKKITSNLRKMLGSDKAASEFLAKAGFVGIKYDGRRDGECFVIFNEADAKITGRTEFYQTPNGTVYGWTDGKKIYLTNAGINPNTPVHEYTHLWAKAMMQKNPKGWQSIKDLLRGTPVWNEVLNDPNYSSIHADEDLVASEVLSRISGTQNAARLEQMAQQMIDEAKGTARKLEARGLIQNIKDALNKFWNWVGTELFGIEKFDSVEQITDRVLWDLMNKTDLGELSEGQVETQIVTDPKVISELDAYEELKKENENNSLSSQSYEGTGEHNTVSDGRGEGVQEELPVLRPALLLGAGPVDGEVSQADFSRFNPISKRDGESDRQRNNRENKFLSFINGLTSDEQISLFAFLKDYGPRPSGVLRERATDFINSIRQKGNNSLADFVEDFINDELKYREGLSSSAVAKHGLLVGVDQNLSAVERMFYAFNKDKYNGVLFDRVLKLAKRFGVTVKFATRNADGSFISEYGSYNPNDNSITLDANLLVKGNESELCQTILHELIHSVVARAASIMTGRAVDTNNQFIDPQSLPKDVIDGINTLKEVYDAIKDDATFHETYGKKDFQEMLSEITDPKFRGLLKAKKLWKKFLNGICQILGIADGVSSESNALTEIESALDKILSAAEQGGLDSAYASYLGQLAEGYTLADLQRLGSGPVKTLLTQNKLFRTGIDPDEVARETAKSVYERIVNENWQEFQRQFQDAMQPVRIAIDAIQQETGNIPIEDYENFLLMFNQASSRSRVEIDDFSRRYYSPIIESINEIVNSIIEARGGNTGNKKERAYAYQEIMNYLIAKHGLERNKYYQSTKTRKLTEAEKAKAVSKAQKAYDDAVDAINAMELTDDERADMLAKAQEQFNAELEDIETREVPDMRDYSGLTSLFGFPPKKFKEAEEEAQRLVDDFEKMLGRVDDESGETVTPSEQIEKLWKNINAATSKTLRHSYESGMLSRQQYNDIKDMFKFYIPLRGFNETTAEDVYSYARFEGNRFNPAVHKAKGRTSVADDPIATIMNMAESEIAQGNKNRAKQALYNFLLNRAAGKADQNSLMQVESVWYLKKEDESGKEYYEIAVPNRDAGETYEEFEERMKVLEAEEKAVKSKKGKLNVGMRFHKPANINAHYVFLKVNGVEKAIYINGDPKAAQAINGEHKKKRNELVEKMGALNRFISSMFTNYSLEFTARNYFRDMFYSHINIDVKESDPAYRKKFRQNWRHNNLRSMVKMLKAYRAGEYEGRDLNEDEKAFVEFMRNGGQTGYTLINSVETHKKDLERAIANMQKGIEKGGVKDSTIFKFTLGSIELLNEASELVTRFAAFKTSRDMGRGINTSIADAKEVTVNFNTKGAQDGKGVLGWFANYFGWSKYFFNASVQGVQNLKSMAEANKLKFGSVIGGMIATGFLMPVITSAIASLFGNDDEEYWNIPEYERQNNFCIPIGNGKYVKVPLPIGFREVYAIGDMVAAAAFDKKFTRDLSQVGTDIANKLASIILPINPLESTANGLGFWHMFGYTTLPSFAQVAIQNMTNTDWKGAPLQKEYTYNEDDPQWMKAFASNPDWMKGLSKWCNEHINLDGDYKGMDWSPERLDNTLSNLFGGIYSLVKKTGKSISMIWNEENRNLSNIPLSGVVLGSGIDNDDRFVTDAYYDMKEYYDSNVNYINRMAKRFGYTLEDVFEKEKGKHHPKMNEIYSNENFDFMQEWYTGVKELDAINDKIKKLDKKIAAKETPTEQDMLKWSRLNDKYMTERRDFVNDMLELD